jgi:hypothetical protein
VGWVAVPSPAARWETWPFHNKSDHKIKDKDKDKDKTAKQKITLRLLPSAMRRSRYRRRLCPLQSHGSGTGQKNYPEKQDKRSAAQTAVDAET